MSNTMNDNDIGGLAFVKIGMRVEFEINNKITKGTVVGLPQLGNVEILFDNRKTSLHCKSKWRLRYYDDDGSVISEYFDN